MKTPIFIEYETKTREFDGKLLLITNILNQGFNKVYFGFNRPLRKEALRNTNGIYFFKSISKNEEDFYKELKRLGYKLILLHAEGGIHYKDNESSIRSSFNPLVMKYFDFNYVFGSAVLHSIIKFNSSNVETNNIIVSGEPRFDLLKPKYKFFFKDQISKIKHKYTDFILINTSFSAANPESDKLALEKYWLNEPTFTQKAKDLLMYKMKYLDSVVELFIEAIELLAVNFPDKNFIIRPHPSESSKIYIKKFQKFKNVFVEKKGNVAVWILASKGVIHYDCTTGMEALLAEKPVISFIPKLDERIVAWLPIKLSMKIDDKFSLVNEVDHIFNNKFSNKISDDVKDLWIKSIHNAEFESSPIISDHLKNLFVSQNLQTYNENKLGSYFIRQKYNFRMRAKSFLYRVLNKKDVGELKKGSFSKNEVKNKLTILNNIQNFSTKFKVKKITIDSVFIEREVN